MIGIGALSLLVSVGLGMSIAAIVLLVALAVIDWRKEELW
jgi:hypothetical protein